MTSTPKRKKKEKKADRGTSAEQTSADQASKEESAPSAKSKSKLAKYAVALVVIALATAGGLFAIDYFNRAPLREARQKLAEEDYNYALVVLKEYSANHPDDKIAKSLMGRAYAGLKDYEKCISIYEEIEGAFEFEDMFAFGKALTINLDYNEAYNNWIGVMGLINDGALDDFEPKKKNQIHGEALYLMAVCQSQLGQLDRSLDTVNDLLLVEGNELYGKYLKGLILAKRGKELEAIKEWDYVREKDPSISNLKIPPYLFFYELGLLKVEQGFAEEGIEILKQSLTSNKFENLQRAAECMESIGTAYDELGNAEMAEFYWKKLIEFEQQSQTLPSHVAREGLANLALQNKSPEEAISWMVQLKQTGAADRSSSTYIMQRAHAMLGNKVAAKQFEELTKSLRESEKKINTIRQALESHPGTYWSNVIRAYDFARDKNWQQAELLLDAVKENLQDKFSKELYQAVKNQTALPSLEDVPLELF